ncbi:hypothetical protein [Algoriphagus pacificus]|uniref:GyrI-like small molecule binding domain-containing protein n=1 Tax=Algoriphagus pacificus TaxID=2811234 RepID=A0ABS3CNS3_9BACT|nr:hypothetical protein [Algoriphagus pacificus]MBN7817885.1 hypothetical protein [Algoriphagus pacificus]
MKKRFAIGALLLVIMMGVGYWGFDKMGGNNPIEIKVIDKNPPTLVGLFYRGTPQDPALEKAFKSVESQKGLHPGSFLHTIYYSEPAGKLDTLEVFIGIDQNLPIAEFELKDFEESQYLLATIRGSKWVMPNPTTVQEKLKEFASSNQLKLTGIFIDKIVSESEVQVLAPIQNKN